MESRKLHLGARVDPASGAARAERFEIEATRLTGHALVIGAPGTGRTGLGVTLLEEALAAGVPAIALDTQGDLSTLLLSFPEGTPADYRPWVDPDDARRAGWSLDTLAARTAERWVAGLDGSGVGRDRRARLATGVDRRILTPGSTLGTGLDILGALRSPGMPWGSDIAAQRDEIEGLVSGMLSLLGLAADPLTSREHVLLANLVEHAWERGIELDVATLLAAVQQPPVRRLGVFEVDELLPPEARMKLRCS